MPPTGRAINLDEGQELVAVVIAPPEPALLFLVGTDV